MFGNNHSDRQRSSRGPLPAPRWHLNLLAVLSLFLCACNSGSSDQNAAVNHIPLAVADSATTDENTAVTINLAANDSGLKDAPVVYSLDAAASNGTVTVSPDGNFGYLPDQDFDGTDSFVYTVTDDDGERSTAQVNITVLDAGVIWPQPNSPVTGDVEIEVSMLLDQMTLEEKVGQMVMAEIQEVTAADVRDYHLGALLNGGGSWPGQNKNASVADWVTLADSFYQASTDTSDGGVAIPVLWGTDAVHGHNNVIGATIFPHNIGLGATNNPALMRLIGEATALEVVATGIDWVFAPTLAVVRNDRWGRTYEGYSEDPDIVKAFAGEFITGLQGVAGTGDLFSPAHVLATAKHYLGDGGTLNGDDQGDTVVTEEELRDIHAQGYVSALAAGAQTVMASYSSWNGSKLHGDEYLLTEVLKEKMGFNGFVLGDWNGHAQVPGCDNSSCAQSFIAGVDMMMVPWDWKDFITSTITQVQNGTIPVARIDEAVTRILRVKMRAGLFDKGTPSARPHANDTSLLASAAHRDIARQAVRESLVLLKNSNNLLPLDLGSNVLVAGSAADNIGQQCGGWSITWQGTDNTNANFPQATSILSGIQSAMASAGGTVTYSADGTFDPASTPDVAIVVFGENPYAEYFGDLFNIEYQFGNKSDLALLQSLRAQNIPVVSIFLSGRPLWVNKELNSSDAFVAAWLPGSEGAGIADVIFKTATGEINFDFTGKLSFSWPAQANQLVLNRYDATYEPLFPYGFGLTFADIDTLGDFLDETGSGSVPTVIPIPGTVEAELFTSSFGIQTESTTDTGGGSNVGYVDPGDWLEYSLEIGSAGSYEIEYRVASQTGSTGFKTLIDGIEIDSQTVALTGGWQSWETNTATATLPAGEHTLRINAVGPSWNLNWIRFSLTGN